MRVRSLFAAWKHEAEKVNNGFLQWVGNEKLPYISLDAVCKAFDELIDTPAENIADAAYKVEISIGEVDEVGGDDEGLDLLKRALVALQAGSVATARKMLNQALNGEADYEFPYKGAAAALADLQRLDKKIPPFSEMI